MGVQGTLIERYVGGPNIVFLNGHDWKRHRKVIHACTNILNLHTLLNILQWR